MNIRKKQSSFNSNTYSVSRILLIARGYPFKTSFSRVLMEDDSDMLKYWTIKKVKNLK